MIACQLQDLRKFRTRVAMPHRQIDPTVKPELNMSYALTHFCSVIVRDAQTARTGGMRRLAGNLGSDARLSLAIYRDSGRPGTRDSPGGTPTSPNIRWLVGLLTVLLFCNGVISADENMQVGHIRINQRTYSIDSCVTFTALSCDLDAKRSSGRSSSARHEIRRVDAESASESMPPI